MTSQDAVSEQARIVTKEGAGSSAEAAEGASAIWLNLELVWDAVSGLAILIAIGFLLFFIVRRYVLRAVGAFAKRSPTKWDDLLFQHRVFHRLTWATPLIILHQGTRFLPKLPEEFAALLQRLSFGVLAIVAVRAFAAAIVAANEIYQSYPRAKERPIKGYLQVASIVAHIVAIIIFIATLADKSPLVLFSGLGAMTAIFMLVFRDSLLSLVAGIQITTNDLVRVGDWIEMPQFLADGDVIDIALNSVSVQNWDKTITVIPTHKFLENSFKNWRGMQQTGGRRIKRSIHIDIGTIRFLTDEEIERFGKFELLSDYIARKKSELEEHNKERDSDVAANTRRLTNIGTLRAYIMRYLKQHTGIHQGLFILVRQLQPTAEGLPIEIYAFSNDVRWAIYEGTQADIFDHVIALLPEFGLRMYQAPSSYDFGRALSGATASKALAAQQGAEGAGPMLTGGKEKALPARKLGS